MYKDVQLPNINSGIYQKKESQNFNSGQLWENPTFKNAVYIKKRVFKNIIVTVKPAGNINKYSKCPQFSWTVRYLIIVIRSSGNSLEHHQIILKFIRISFF